MVYILSKNHFSNYSSDYDKKIKELHGQVEKKAKEVQRVSEEKDSLVKEVNILGIRKTNLIKKITELEKQFILSEKKLNNNIKRKTIFIDIAKKDLNKERLIFKEVNQSIKILNEKLFNLNSVSKEIISFILKGKNARKKYLDEQKNIDNAKKEYLSIQKNNVKEKKNINKIKIKIDKSKKSITDLFSKLSWYSDEVRRATKFLNKRLNQNKIPLTYGLPVNKLTKIKF